MDNTYVDASGNVYEPIEKPTVKWRIIGILLAISLIYLISPIDLVPDVAPPVTYIDDALVGVILPSLPLVGYLLRFWHFWTATPEDQIDFFDDDPPEGVTDQEWGVVNLFRFLRGFAGSGSEANETASLPEEVLEDL